MVITLMAGVCLIFQFCCDAHVITNELTACDGNCSEHSCIRNYAELESYILNNETVLSEIVEAFFKTGKAPSNFVKITYDFQIPDNSHNDTMDFEENNNCTDRQDVYFWSSSPLYLLGPKSLYYATLFAVNVDEERLTISLPCLCEELHGIILSRLTYMVHNKSV